MVTWDLREPREWRKERGWWAEGSGVSSRHGCDGGGGHGLPLGAVGDPEVEDRTKEDLSNS